MTPGVETTQVVQGSANSPTPDEGPEAALALELFQRTGISSALGILGVGLMVFPHLGIFSMQSVLFWTCPMVVIFFARIVFSGKAIDALEAGQNAIPLVNFETFLCALTGLAWGNVMYAFDSAAMDQTFYLRLMILAGAVAFIVSSTSVFVRVFLAYTMPVGISVAVFVLSHDYVQPRNALMTSIILYMIMITALALTTNRRTRAATINHLALIAVSAELNKALDSKHRLLESLNVLARMDELTGISNRRAILGSLKTEMARCQRFNWPLAILMIDVDHFKRINDTYGHAGGDALLRAVAKKLGNTMRDTDLIGRWGGEEFLLVLPAQELQNAALAAERLRESVQTEALEVAGRVARVTISIGVGVFRKGDSEEQLLARADEALYRAKCSGRNQIAMEEAGKINNDAPPARVTSN